MAGRAIVFWGFGCVTLYKALSGEASCGCFGKVPVNPWYTLLLDMAAVTALLWCRPNPAPSRVFERDCRRLLRPAEVAMACLALGIPAAVAMGSYRAATLGEEGDILGDSDFVVLEPESWVRRQFPLLRYIDIGDQLAEGQWIVVLYDHDCPKCKEAVPRFEVLARELAGQSDPARVALIEMPPYARLGDGLASPYSPCVLGHLDDTKEWFVTAPVEIMLQQGIVVRLDAKKDSIEFGKAVARVRMLQKPVGYAG